MDTLSFQSRNNGNASLENLAFTPLTAAAIYLEQQQKQSSSSSSSSLRPSSTTEGTTFRSTSSSLSPPLSSSTNLPHYLSSYSLPPLTTGCSNLDQLFGNYGGIPRIGITELSGEAGSGKSTMGFQLCISAVVYGGSAIYINCEGTGLLAVERMIDIAVAELHKKYSKEEEETNNRKNDKFLVDPPSSSSSVSYIPSIDNLRQEAHQLLGYIHIISPTDRDDLSVKLNLCQALLKQNNHHNYNNNSSSSSTVVSPNDKNTKDSGLLLSSVSSVPSVRPIRIIVLDSIGSVYRFIDNNNNNNSTLSSSSSNNGLYDSEIMMDRARGIFSLASLLKSFNTVYGVHIIVINQISDIMDQRLPVLPSSVSVANITVQKISSTENISTNNNSSSNSNSSGNPLPLPTLTLARTMNAIPTNGRWVRPSLGLTWDNCCTVRVFFTHERSIMNTNDALLPPVLPSSSSSTTTPIPPPSFVSIPSSIPSAQRYILLINSPYQAPCICPIVLNENGIHGINKPERIKWLM